MRKKILIGGGIILVAGIWLLWFLGGRVLERQATSTLPEKITQIDTDQDGLADWEEALWQTDKNNPDTDGDGTSDGEEIALSRNPKIAGPDDAITNPTDRASILARNAMSNNKLPPIIDVSPTDIPTDTVIKIGNLNITNDENLVTITKYRDDVRQILTQYFSQTTTKELDSLIQFIDTNNQSLLLSITTEQGRTESLLKSLATIVVPKSIAPAHLVMLNTLGEVIKLQELMTQVEKEPVLALKSGQLLSIKKYEFLATLIPINEYFIKNGLHEKITS